jgi:hypothetical protein
MKEEQLRRWWLQRRRRPLSALLQEEILDWVRRARGQLSAYASLEDCLEQRGIQWEISQRHHEVAGVRFRAQLDLNTRRLTVYAGALDELERSDRPRKVVERVILSHEVFHLLCPHCPSALHEAAAHWFAAEVTGLPEFPGIWDLSSE